MVEPFTVEAKISYDDYKKFAWFWYLRLGKSIWPTVVLYGAALALVLSIAVYEIFLRGFRWQATAPVMIVLIYIPLILFSNWIRMSNGYKKRWGFPIRYAFSPDGFHVEFLGAPAPNHEEYKYGALRRVGEKEKVFYLDWGNGEYYIVPKSSMGGEAQARFAALLKQWLGKKYIQCY